MCVYMYMYIDGTGGASFYKNSQLCRHKNPNAPGNAGRGGPPRGAPSATHTPGPGRRCRGGTAPGPGTAQWRGPAGRRAGLGGRPRAGLRYWQAEEEEEEGDSKKGWARPVGNFFELYFA